MNIQEKLAKGEAFLSADPAEIIEAFWQALGEERQDLMKSFIIAQIIASRKEGEPPEMQREVEQIIKAGWFSGFGWALLQMQAGAIKNLGKIKMGTDS